MAATLSASIILADVLDAFKVRFPMFRNMTTDFSSAGADLSQSVIARIRSLPTVRDYDATNGYQANAANANDLVTDVPVTINRHKHVPVKVDYIDSISTRRDIYSEVIADLAYSLGKEAFDYILSLVVDANFSQFSEFALADSDKDMLDNVTKDMNGVGARPDRRVGIVNSDVYNYLEADARIASGDYHGQKRLGNAYGQLSNVAGFQTIYEYPSLPANSEDLTAFFFTPEALIFASRIPNKFTNVDSTLAKVADVSVQEDAETGLAFAAVEWVQQGTFDHYVTLCWLYGAKAGSQGGSDGALTDYAGHRVTLPSS